MTRCAWSPLAPVPCGILTEYPLQAWQAYIKLEERYHELERASAIYERWIGVRPTPKNWVLWARFEEERGRTDKAREVFQTALEFFGDAEEEVERAQSVFAAFARMETRLKEFDRARTIYKFALARLPRSKSASCACGRNSGVVVFADRRDRVAVYSSYTKFEKQRGCATCPGPPASTDTSALQTATAPASSRRSSASGGSSTRRSSRTTRRITTRGFPWPAWRRMRSGRTRRTGRTPSRIVCARCTSAPLRTSRRRPRSASGGGTSIVSGRVLEYFLGAHG